MKSFRLAVLVMVIVMVVPPLAVFAQGGDEAELVEYTSEDELLTAGLPVDWIAGPIKDYPFPSIVAGNTEEAYARFVAGEDMIEGDQYLMVFVISLDVLPMLEIELPDEATLLDATTAFAGAFVDDTASDTPESVVGEVEEFDLSEDVTGAYVLMSDKEGEGAMIGVDLGDGVLGLVFVATYPGGFTDELGDLGKQVAGTIVFTGTVDDVLAGLMGSAGDDGSSGDTSALDGEALVAERCTVCHDTGRIDKADKDEAGWTTTVDRMIGKGAQLSEAERAAVIAYLVETH